MAIVINDVIRVTYWQRLFSQRVLTVLHMRCTTAPGAGTDDFTALNNLSQVLAAPTDPLMSKWRALVAPDLLFDEVRSQKVYPSRSVYGSSAMGYTGTFAGTANTANIAASIEKRSSVPGRRGIGRVQMAGVPTVALVSGSFTSAYLTAVRTAWLEMLIAVASPVDGAVYQTCLWGGLQTGPSTDLIDVQAKDTVRTMHRRTVRVGE